MNAYKTDLADVGKREQVISWFTVSRLNILIWHTLQKKRKKETADQTNKQLNMIKIHFSEKTL